MKLNTPRWWYAREPRHASVLRFMLKPVSWIWAAATARRIAKATPSIPARRSSPSAI
jgi:tetraacyldisaccharide 4'-kinase